MEKRVQAKELGIAVVGSGRIGTFGALSCGFR
jgi:hypothetical protein